ncbi:hypothetical protein P7C70_g3742, partial [Phenoliferia sp. Uapishka_3]
MTGLTIRVSRNEIESDVQLRRRTQRCDFFHINLPSLLPAQANASNFNTFWSTEETETVARLASAYTNGDGDVDWEAVSDEHGKGRTPGACRARLLRTGLHTGSMVEAESPRSTRSPEVVSDDGNLPRRKQVEDELAHEDDEKRLRKKSASRWSPAENSRLKGLILGFHQKNGRQILSEADWESIADELDRSWCAVRQHWWKLGKKVKGNVTTPATKRRIPIRQSTNKAETIVLSDSDSDAGEGNFGDLRNKILDNVYPRSGKLQRDPSPGNDIKPRRETGSGDFTSTSSAGANLSPQHQAPRASTSNLTADDREELKIRKQLRDRASLDFETERHLKSQQYDLRFASRRKTNDKLTNITLHTSRTLQVSPLSPSRTSPTHFTTPRDFYDLRNDSNTLLRLPILSDSAPRSISAGSTSILTSIRAPFRTLQHRPSRTFSVESSSTLGEGWSFNTTQCAARPTRSSSLTSSTHMAHLAGGGLGGGIGIPGGRTSKRAPTSSVASSTEAYRRRSSALLELDEGFQSSIQRASDALNASRRSRVEAELRMDRDRTRSTHFVEAEVQGHERTNSYDRYLRENELKRMNMPSTITEKPTPNQLKKSRSVDLLSPRHNNDVGHHRTNQTYTNDNFTKTHHHHHATVSHALQDDHHEPRSSNSHFPATRHRSSTLQTTGNAPHVYLPIFLPVPSEPPSKFSASTGNSQLDEKWTGTTLDDMMEGVGRQRARTISHVHSFRNLLKKTPSKLSLRKKGSLASLFGVGSGAGSSGESSSGGRPSSNAQQKKKEATDFKAKLSTISSPTRLQSRIPTPSSGASSKGQDNTDSSPSPPTFGQARKTPKSMLLKKALREITGGHKVPASSIYSHNSYTSPSEAGTSESSGRTSEGRTSEDTSSSGRSKNWVGKLGRAVSGKREDPSPAPVLRLATKVPAAFPASHLPSRIPISALFAESTGDQSINDSPSLRKNIGPPRPRPRAVYSPTPEEDCPPDVAAPPALTRIDTTFFPRARPVHRRANLPPPNTRPLSLIGTIAATSNNAQNFPDAFPAPNSLPSRLPFKIKRPLPPPVLLPPVELRSISPRSPKTEKVIENRPQSLTLGCLSVTSSSDDDPMRTPPSPSPSRGSFRSPSPARFRDLLPSPSASSSPEKTSNGLPAPNVSPKSSKGGSPKKLAMGPEQIISMEAAQAGPEQGITQVFGATTDLADLLSALDDTTEEISRNLAVSQSGNLDVQDLSASLRQYLPRVESLESLRSTVSDVPDDLRLLIQSVSDHISEVDFALDGEEDLEYEDEEPEVAFGFQESEDLVAYDGEDDHESEHAEATTDEILRAYDSNQSAHHLAPFDGMAKMGVQLGSNGSSTASSFEGHVSTAAMALRSMLDGPGPGEKEPRYTRPLSIASAQVDVEADNIRGHRQRDSVQEYLAMERPTVGDKIFDNMDTEVSLKSLVDAQSPPPSPEQTRRRSYRDSGRPQTHRADSTDSSGTCSIMGSPTPANGLRRNIVRYSADPTRIRTIMRPTSVQSESSSSSSDFDRPPSPPQDATSMSLAQSTRSTNLSISSLNSSPCAGPRRRVPMLTRNPISAPNFRFPPPRSKPSPVVDADVLPWTQTNTSTTPEKSNIMAPGSNASPFKRAFNPLEQFRNKTQRKLIDEPVVDPNVKVANASPGTSPRFVRPLHPTKAGTAIPRPRPLSSQSSKNALIPPDTPPPSSPSASDNESMRSSQSSMSSFRSAAIITIDPPTHPISIRSSKGHSRQVSIPSSLLQDTIIEERESPHTSPAGNRTLGATDVGGLATILEPVSPGVPSDIVIEDEYEEEEYQRVEESSQPGTFDLTFMRPDPPAEEILEYESDDLGEDEDDSRVMRSFVHYAYEADTEIKRSRAIWPDTEASLEAMAHFNAPEGWHAIIQFILDSRIRFASAAFPSHLSPFAGPFHLDGLLDAPALPEMHLDSIVKLPTPPTPSLSPDDSASPPSVQNYPSDTPLSPLSPSPIVVKPRRILGEKPINRQLILTQSTSSPRKEEVLSPFTALPPKLMLKGRLRGLKAKLSPSPKKKVVDVTFLSNKPTKRRVNQWDAARRKLEGVGAPEEQRSDDEDTTGDTGVLEAAGEGSAFTTFVKTPKLSTSRPKVRRKPGLTHLR